MAWEHPLNTVFLNWEGDTVHIVVQFTATIASGLCVHIYTYYNPSYKLGEKVWLVDLQLRLQLTKCFVGIYPTING